MSLVTSRLHRVWAAAAVAAAAAVCVLGAGPAAVGDLGISTMAQALQLQTLDVTLLGPDVQVRARPTRHTGAGPTTGRGI